MIRIGNSNLPGSPIFFTSLRCLYLHAEKKGYFNRDIVGEKGE